MRFLLVSRVNILHTGSGRIETTVFPLHRGPGSPAGVFIWRIEKGRQRLTAQVV
jgi:hypothetical protein